MSTLQGNTTTIENLLRSVNNLPNVGADDAVLYIDQTLTDAQKAQARTNIGAASADEVAGKMDKVTGTEDQVIGFDADGNPVAREAPSGGGGVQPDWNQNDEAQPDFIKNKPFGDVETVLYEGANLEIFQDGEMYIAQLPATFEFVSGNQYTLVFDGVSYVSGVSYAYGMAYIGNPMFMGGGDNGQPFFAVFDSGSLVVTSLTGFSSLSISTLEAKTLDSRYFPKAVRMFYSWENSPYLFTDTGLTVKATSADVSAAQYFYVAYAMSGVVVECNAVLNWSIDPTHGYIKAKLADDTVHYTAEYTAS